MGLAVLAGVAMVDNPAWANDSTNEAEPTTPHLESVYIGPTFAPLVGVGAIAGIEWRLFGGLRAGVEFGLLDQSPLRVSYSLRAVAVASHTFAFGGYGAIRLATGYRHVFVRGDTYEVSDEGDVTTSAANCGLWSSQLEMVVGFDATGPWGWPVRLTVAPGIVASYPQLETVGFDLALTARLAWRF